MRWTKGPHSSNQLAAYLKPRIGGAFKGIVCHDTPTSYRTKGRAGWIVNIDPKGEAGKGTHWTALCVDGPRSYYYDPAGYPPPRPLFETLKRQGLMPLYSTTKSQVGGNDCGARSAYALERLVLSKNPAATFRDVLAA